MTVKFYITAVATSLASDIDPANVAFKQDKRSDSRDIIFTVLSVIYKHKDGMTLYKGPLGFGSTESRSKTLYSDN